MYLLLDNRNKLTISLAIVLLYRGQMPLSYVNVTLLLMSKTKYLIGFGLP